MTIFGGDDAVMALLGSFLTLNDTYWYSTSVFGEISAFHRNLRGLNLNEYEPQLTRKTIVHPA